MKLLHVQILCIVAGLVMVSPQMAPPIIEAVGGGSPEMFSFNGLTSAGMFIFFLGFALGKFRKKEDKSFQLTKKMSDVDVSENDYETSFSDDD